METRILTPEQAWAIVCEFVKDENLRRHMWAVGAAMRHYGRRLDEDAGYWQAVGLLHDFDWEIHPDLDRHPAAGAPLLRERGVDEDTIRTILSHNTEGTGVERSQSIDFALLACDEITGLITAVTLVRPSRDVRGVELRSIRKKWKDGRFAAGVDREHVAEAVHDFSRVSFGGRLELWEHVESVLKAMQDEAEALGLDGRTASDNEEEPA